MVKSVHEKRQIIEQVYDPEAWSSQFVVSSINVNNTKMDKFREKKKYKNSEIIFKNLDFTSSKLIFVKYKR